MRLLATLLVASLGATLLTAAPAPAIAPAPSAPPLANLSVPLAIGSFNDLVVDEAHGHVYISDGKDQLLVRDLDGAAVSAITGLDQPRGMTLSEDGDTLYVALQDARILAVDTTTLTTTSLPAGTGSCPIDVAATAGLLWIANQCGGPGQLDALDPEDGTVTPALDDLIYFTSLDASPALPGRIFWTGGGSLTEVVVTATPTPALTPCASVVVGSNTRDVAISPDGQTVVTASGSPYEHPAFHTGDLSPAGVYTTAAYPNAVAFRADGLLAAGISGWYEPDVYLFTAADTAPWRNYEFGGIRNELLPGGLAFGGTRMYAVTGDIYRYDNFRLRVITPRAVSSLQVRTDRATYDYGKKVTVRVMLDTLASSQRAVRVYATPRGGDRTLIGSGTVPSGTKGELAVHTRATTRTTYSVEYDGDEQSDPSTASTKPVSVRAKLVAQPYKQTGKSGKYYLWPVTKTAYVHAQVKPNHAGDCIVFQGQWLVRGHWGYDGTTKCVHLNKDSWGGVYVTGDKDLLPYAFRFRGVFNGDKDNRAAKSPWVYGRFVRGRVAASESMGDGIPEVSGSSLRQ